MLLLKKRGGSLVFIAVCALAVLLPVVFLACGAPHDCSGEDCHICAALRQTLRRTFDAVSLLRQNALVFLPFAGIAMLCACLAAPRAESAALSKIRLND